MNETLKTIYERRAVRKYSDKQVDKEIINQIIDAGRMAPSAINMQPWKFYVLTKKETIEMFANKIRKATFKSIRKINLKSILRMAEGMLHFSKGINFLKEHDPVFHGAPVVVFISAPKDNEWASLDVGMCAQNMMLAAKSLGLESCPIGFGKFVEQTKIYPQLKIPKNDRVLISLVFGYGIESPETHERIKNNVKFID